MANKNINIVSWNVNGLRARLKKGQMEDFLLNENEPIQILCLQKLNYNQNRKSQVVNYQII